MAGDTLVATMSRPRELNAVSSALLEELVQLADWLKYQTSIHFLILDHEGPAFSAGAHLKEVSGILDDKEHAVDRLRINQIVATEMVRKMSNVEQITFAAVRGPAYGAGVGIAMTCDFRVMEENAKFNLPETRLGMFLTYGLTPSLVASIGLAKAKEMIMFCEDWDAEKCQQAGLVEHVVGTGAARTKIASLIDQLRTMDWQALRLVKRIANSAAAAIVNSPSTTEVELAGFAIAGGEVATHLNDFVRRKAESKN
ncbi:enoyl-CoA hydratase/isomerase family protein [Ottowia sp. GY511]|uniref:Enoyl-CoA hydratase/isomerase family protein n=1 Tax=Ottowia flava TaxID=2675430 RepID=A0ABW4KQR7_9BURK|nr:enoyl-CoA hydratase/isomerase family protein [Ottowia sp. GY511]TXK33010.1 enoyl-CoA hydratase/isomerase family protein [Ottowia sp. GY511]